MSRSEFAPGLAAALDRFDVPPMHAGFADRVAAAASGSTLAARAALRRDRRGMWKRGRQFVVGTIAVGLLSAAAVASGLLGAAGIRVPVLTAILAPDSVVVAKPVKVAATKPRVPAKRTPVPAMAAPPVVDPVSAGPVQRTALEARIERVAKRRAFVASRPRLARFVAATPAQRRVFLARHPELARTLRERRVARRNARIERIERIERLNPPPMVPPDGATTAPLIERPVLFDRQQPVLGERFRAARATPPAPDAATAPVDPIGPDAAPVARQGERAIDRITPAFRPQITPQIRERRAIMRDRWQQRRQMRRGRTPN